MEIPPLGDDAPRINGRDIATLHFELAAEVKAVRERQQDIIQQVQRLEMEARQPKPIPWGVISSAVGAMAAIILGVGALIHQNIDAQIMTNKEAQILADKINADRITDFDVRYARREDGFASKVEVEEMKTLLKEMEPRAETVARLIAMPPSTSKAEFEATISAIAARQVRNEGFIDEVRKAETINRRIDQLYEMYRQLQAQQLDLHSICQRPSQTNSK